MASRSHEDDDETEMARLQGDGRPADDSEDERAMNGHHKDAEQQNIEGDGARHKQAAYRKCVWRSREGCASLTLHRLYGIITIMTMILFALNIVQVCLLPVISNLYWIILCPGIIFIIFTAWAWIFIASNQSLFRSDLGSLAEGGRRAGQRLGALFLLKGRSERSNEYGEADPNCKQQKVLLSRESYIDQKREQGRDVWQEQAYSSRFS